MVYRQKRERAVASSASHASTLASSSNTIFVFISLLIPRNPLSVEHRFLITTTTTTRGVIAT